MNAAALRYATVLPISVTRRVCLKKMRNVVEMEIDKLQHF